MDNTTLLLELVNLSKKGSLDSSTLALSKKLGISQQSVSRKLMELEKQKIIRRMVWQRGVSLIIDAKGKTLLAEKYAALKQFFEEAKPMISGTVKTGLGEGRYYMSQHEYISQFIEKLGFKPYPGTLNLHVEAQKAIIFVNSIEPLRINGFERSERTFGALTGYKVKIQGITSDVNYTRGAVIIPDRTTHDINTMEIISPHYLRDKLKVKDGDEITITGE